MSVNRFCGEYRDSRRLRRNDCTQQANNWDVYQFIRRVDSNNLRNPPPRPPCPPPNQNCCCNPCQEQDLCENLNIYRSSPHRPSLYTPPPASNCYQICCPPFQNRCNNSFYEY